MTTKSQLKQYFKTGDIPTSIQFGELIDSLLSVPSEDTMDRPNQNLFFGNGEENPYMQGIRTISFVIDTSVISLWIFTTHNTNDVKLAIPMFIFSRLITTNLSLLATIEPLNYCVPTKINIDDFINAGLDCDTSEDSEILNQILCWEFKHFEKEDVCNYYILNVHTIVSGAFSTFKFDLADLNIGGIDKRLPVRLIGIVDNDTKLTVTGIYNIKNGINWQEFENDWNNVTSLLMDTKGTVTTTNAMVITRIITIIDKYMVKQ